MGVYRIMDILDKLDLMIDTTVAADVATNTGQGKIDVIGGECPKGMSYDKIKKICVPSKNEASITGGAYIGGNSTIAGSGQTRIWGERHGWMLDLDRKEPVTQEMDDKAKQNILGRKGLQFDALLGAYVPHGDTKIEPRYIDLIKGEIG